MTASLPGTAGSPDADASTLLLEVEGVAKSYGAVKALQQASLTLRAGSVMALLGENGAGKSTLVKVLSGAVRPDRGTIRVEGRDVLGMPLREHRELVAVVQQELSIVGTLTVGENVFLGNSSTPRVRRMRDLAAAARPLLERVGLTHVDPLAPAATLSIAEQQLVEIARVVARAAPVIVFDEPTATLNDHEIKRVHEVVRRLASDGKGIIYVTHRLGEIFEIADVITIVRQGVAYPSEEVSTLDVDAVIERMIGRRLEELYPPRAENFGDPVLTLTGALTEGLREPITMTARAGEIVGLAGQIGCGAPQLLRAVVGRQRITGGEVRLRGDVVTGLGVAGAMDRGVAFCSDDRKYDGTFQPLSVRANFSSPILAGVSRWGWLSRSRERERVDPLALAVGVDPSKLPMAVSSLSGGNQQKVALGKWLSIEPGLLLIEEPTRGVDVGARAEIYALLRRLADEGLCVVFASSDLAEVHGLSDTVATFFRGRLVRMMPAADWTEASIFADVTRGEPARPDGEVAP